MGSRARLQLEIDELQELLGGEFTGEPAVGDQARALSLHCRRPASEPEYSISFFDHSPVPALEGPVPPTGIVVQAPETSGLWRAQVEHLWSMPKPEGPGRSVKLVVVSRDEPADVLGWLELASAPLVMGERDRRFPVSSPNARVDLRTVGAHPEFASWRGASLVGMLGMTDAVLWEWEKRYGDRPELVQTTGAFGVSAIYERKKVPSGRRWTRAQMTSGTYPVLPDSLVDAAKEVAGIEGSRHPVVDGKLLPGRDNMRKRVVRAALTELGWSSSRQRTFTDSLGICRALYVCQVQPTYSRDRQLELDEVYQHWLARYSRRPS
jgi:hypothetical protein